MDIISRSAVILRPKQPFQDWMRQDDKEGLADGVYEHLHEEPHVYLVPDWDDPGERGEILKVFWPALFEAMLMGWVTDPSVWPKDRTQAMFDAWFEVAAYSLVEDIYQDEAIEYLT